MSGRFSQKCSRKPARRIPLARTRCGNTCRRNCTRATSKTHEVSVNFVWPAWKGFQRTPVAWPARRRRKDGRTGASPTFLESILDRRRPRCARARTAALAAWAASIMGDTRSGGGPACPRCAPRCRSHLAAANAKAGRLARPSHGSPRGRKVRPVSCGDARTRGPSDEAHTSARTSAQIAQRVCGWSGSSDFALPSGPRQSIAASRAAAVSQKSLLGMARTARGARAQREGRRQQAPRWEADCRR